MRKKLEDIEEGDRLSVCSFVECAKIRIDEDLWLSRGEDSKLYDRYIKAYDMKLSHGYCPGCYEERIKKDFGVS